MAAILKVIEGPDLGATVRVAPGETVVGKGSRASLRLSSAGVSVEHTVIHNNGDETYFIENLSAHGTMLNETKVHGKIRLRLRDKIRVAEDTLIRLETEGGDSFITQHRQLVIAAVVIMVVAFLGMWWMGLFDTPEIPLDWKRTQVAVANYMDTQIKAGRYPPKMREYFDSALRQEEVGNYKDAEKAWLGVLSVLQQIEPVEVINKTDNRKYRKLLQSKNPDALMDGADGPSLMVQCANDRRNRAHDRVKSGSGMFE